MDLEQARVAGSRNRRERVGERPRVRRVELEHLVPIEVHTDGGPASISAPASSRGRSVRTRIRIGRSSISARSSWKSPAAASRPWDMTRTCEPRRSTSSRTWLETITQRPSPPRRRNNATMSIRWRGSSPVSGSSSTSTGGSCTSACATLTRCRMPLEYVGSRRVSDGSRSNRLQCRDRRGAGIRKPLQPGREDDELARGQRLEDAFLLRDEADPPRDPGVGAGIAAEHAYRPLRGAGEPAEHPEHGRLAGAVRPEQGRHSGPDVEADVRDGDEWAEPLRDAVRDDTRLVGHRNASSRR